MVYLGWTVIQNIKKKGNIIVEQYVITYFCLSWQIYYYLIQD